MKLKFPEHYNSGNEIQQYLRDKKKDQMSLAKPQLTAMLKFSEYGMGRGHK